MTKWLNKRRYLPLVLVIGLIAILAQPTASAATFTSNWTDTPPTIDGTMDGSEWANAYQNPFGIYLYPTTTVAYNVSFWAMNDANNLYLCFQWPDSTYGDAGANPDVLWIAFDEHNDGNSTTPAKEDAHRLEVWDLSSFHSDGYTPGPGGWADDTGTQDGSVGFIWNTTHFTVELSIPLACSDPEDLQPGAGSLIGISIVQLDGDSGMPPIYNYPQNGAYSASTSFQLAGPFSLEGFISFLILLIGLAGVAVFLLRPKK